MFAKIATVRRTDLRGPWLELSIIVAAGVAALGLFSEPAEARRRPQGHHAAKHHAAAHHPKQYARGGTRSIRYMRARPFAPTRNFAAIVVDGNSGETLYGRSEDEPRRPASITKVMTLYLLFERLDQGRMRLDDEIVVSKRAAAQKPTKLGLRPGRTIRVDDAIKALVTRSANDIAVAIAEAIAGDEESFAELMTKRAHELGMRNTRYVNASGLPADEQLTTARDLSLLGRAIEERFPRYYRYFATRAFYYGGATIMNHNRLMDRVEGMDGIKTGYTNASGFNLLTSVKRDGRYIVAVVMGGVSAPARDRIMADLIEDQIGHGATIKTASALRDLPARPALAEAPADLPLQAAQRQAPATTEPRVALAYVEAAPAAQNPPQKITLRAIAPNPPQPLDPIRVASISADVPAEKARPAFVSGATKLQAAATPNQATRTASVDGSTAEAAYAPAPTATPSAMRWIVGPAPAVRPRAFEKLGDERLAAEKPTTRQTLARLDPAAARSREVEMKKLDGKSVDGKGAEAKGAEAKGTESRSRDAKEAAPGRPAAARSGWMIQIGATEDVAKANALLARAKVDGVEALGSAQPFTEKVQKGTETLYRARFAGLEEKSAELACKTLKKTGFSCFATKN